MQDRRHRDIALKANKYVQKHIRESATRLTANSYSKEKGTEIQKKIDADRDKCNRLIMEANISEKNKLHKLYQMETKVRLSKNSRMGNCGEQALMG